jgi:hypothetical protein
VKKKRKKGKLNWKRKPGWSALKLRKLESKRSCEGRRRKRVLQEDERGRRKNEGSERKKQSD